MAGTAASAPTAGARWKTATPRRAASGHQLGGRYTVGTYLSADGDGLAYRGVLNDEKKFVLIKEYFPVTLCNGRSADGALMPKEEKEVLFKTSRMDFKDLYDDLKNLTPATGLSTILDVMEENNTVYAVEESEKGMTLSHYLHLRSRTLTPAEARTLLQPIMEGVALLHKSGLIHRGICPDNIRAAHRRHGPPDRLRHAGAAHRRQRAEEPALPGLRRAGAVLCRRVQRALHRCLRAGRGLLQDGHRADARRRAPAQSAGQLESAHSLEAGVLHGSRRCWPARCGWTPPSGCRPCPS